MEHNLEVVTEMLVWSVVQNPCAKHDKTPKSFGKNGDRRIQSRATLGPRDAGIRWRGIPAYRDKCWWRIGKVAYWYVQMDLCVIYGGFGGKQMFV